MTEAFENPESTPVHLPRQAEDKSSIIRNSRKSFMCPHSNIFDFKIFFVLRENSFLFQYRRAIGELGNKDASKSGKDRRETQC